MARIRTIKPEFWGNPQVARCSHSARLLFLALLNESDDEGRQLGSARRIAGFAFPNDAFVNTNHIKKWLGELENAQLIAKYVVDDVEYVCVLGFKAHQKINRPSPSRLPAPPARVAALMEASLIAHGVTSGSLAPDLGNGSRKEDLGSAAPPPWREAGENPMEHALKVVQGESA